MVRHTTHRDAVRVHAQATGEQGSAGAIQVQPAERIIPLRRQGRSPTRVHFNIDRQILGVAYPDSTGNPLIVLGHELIQRNQIAVAWINFCDKGITTARIGTAETKVRGTHRK